MKECVKRLFGHVASKMNPRNLRHCFELLGLDFMIDAKGQVSIMYGYMNKTLNLSNNTCKLLVLTRQLSLNSMLVGCD